MGPVRRTTHSGQVTTQSAKSPLMIVLSKLLSVKIQCIKWVTVEPI